MRQCFVFSGFKERNYIFKDINVFKDIIVFTIVLFFTGGA